MTGDEAYQRRLAMSRGFQMATASEPTINPSLTPLASSQPLPAGEDVAFDQPGPSGILSSPPPAAPRVTETGEEAYLRRLAMSQSRSQPSAVSPPISVHTPEFSEEPPTLSYNPFAPPAVPPPPPPGPPGLSEDRVRSSREAAAAIAARLAALAPPPGTTSEPSGEVTGAPPIQDESAPTKR